MALLFVAVIGSDCLAQDPIGLLEETVTKIVEQSELAVVSIARITQKKSLEDQFERRHHPFQRRRDFFGRDLVPNEMDVLPNEFGAGCLISPPNSAARFVLTNLHVVRGGPIAPNYKVYDDKTQETTELRVQFSDRRGCVASIIAADPRSDLAVLQLNWEKTGIKQSDFPALKWETAAAPRKGQFVILMGNPYAIARDGSASVSWGMISNLTRQPITVRRNDFFDRDEATSNSMLYRLGAVMQLDARLNLGTSGGPVLNLKGELIGISTSLAAVEGYDQSAGFALPIDSLTRRIVRTLLAGQEVEYGMLGIRPAEINGEDFVHLNTGLPQRSAAVVASVTPGSPASQAHILPNDVVVRVENEPVRSVADLMRLVGLHSPDSEIEVTLWRLSQRRLETVRIRLGKWPVQDDEGIIETNPRYAAWRGLTVDFSTARSRFIDESADVPRVLITKVAENSPGRTAQLEPGNFITHVGNAAVQSPAEFYAAVKGLTGAVSLRLWTNDPSPAARAARVIQVRE